MSNELGHAGNVSDEDWYVPKHHVNYFDGVTSEVAVVIPVINEAERLGALLTRMGQRQVSTYADIVIVDGGSTDGSVNPVNLREAGVKGLLTYQGRSGLSAQLQVAYAFCLRQGYKSVVTIDGNNKDDPEAIPRFIGMLREGFDFVQGSRFLKDGSHENTPLSRLLAVRLIHAPLLSVASGFWWTDTTQGFRGYSERLLRNVDLGIFREGFSGYTLLAYLSYRAPKFGLRVVEIGTRRTYPQGKPPTKLGTLSSKIRLLFSLLQVVLGQFNPRRVREVTGSK